MATLTESPPAPFPNRLAPRPIRVVVAEDHPLYREGLVRSLSARAPEVVVVGEADDGIDALAMVEALEPDVALLDLRMPGLDGIEVCDRVSALDPRPGTKLLVVSAFADAELVRRAVRAGAAGYLDKNATHDVICDAVLNVAEGGIAFTDRTRHGVNVAFDELG